MYIICDEDFKALFKLERIRVSTLTNHCKKHIFKIEKEKSDKDKKKSGSQYSYICCIHNTLYYIL